MLPRFTGHRLVFDLKSRGNSVPPRIYVHAEESDDGPREEPDAESDGPEGAKEEGSKKGK